jgi:LmbE family N-acetylglucosaminyl deacetylase
VEIHSFFNAPLPVSSFPARHELHKRWCKDGDPEAVIASAINEFAPDLILTFEPTYGATNHPEHQLTSRLTTAAALSSGTTAAVYYCLRRHWFFRILRQADPGPVEEWFDGSLPPLKEGDHGSFSAGGTCQSYLVELTRLHASQAADLEPFRKFARLFRRLGLRQADLVSAPRPDAP